VIDNAAVPALVDAAGGIAIGAVMFAQGEGRNDHPQHGENQQQISHRSSSFFFSVSISAFLARLCRLCGDESVYAPGKSL
jgi:hypothetical protein